MSPRLSYQSNPILLTFFHAALCYCDDSCLHSHCSKLTNWTNRSSSLGQGEVSQHPISQLRWSLRLKELTINSTLVSIPSNFLFKYDFRFHLKRKQLPEDFTKTDSANVCYQICVTDPSLGPWNKVISKDHVVARREPTETTRSLNRWSKRRKFSGNEREIWSKHPLAQLELELLSLDSFRFQKQ